VNQALVFGVDVAAADSLRRDDNRIVLGIASIVAGLALASDWLAEVSAGCYALLRLLLFTYY